MRSETHQRPQLESEATLPLPWWSNSSTSPAVLQSKALARTPSFTSVQLTLSPNKLLSTILAFGSICSEVGHLSKLPSRYLTFRISTPTTAPFHLESRRHRKIDAATPSQPLGDLGIAFFSCPPYLFPVVTGARPVRSSSRAFFKKVSHSPALCLASEDFSRRSGRGRAIPTHHRPTPPAL